MGANRGRTWVQIEEGPTVSCQPLQKCMKKAIKLPYTVSVTIKCEYNMNRVWMSENFGGDDTDP